MAPLFYWSIYCILYILLNAEQPEQPVLDNLIPNAKEIELRKCNSLLLDWFILSCSDTHWESNHWCKLRLLCVNRDQTPTEKTNFMNCSSGFVAKNMMRQYIYLTGHVWHYCINFNHLEKKDVPQVGNGNEIINPWSTPFFSNITNEFFPGYNKHCSNRTETSALLFTL